MRGSIERFRCSTTSDDVAASGPKATPQMSVVSASLQAQDMSHRHAKLLWNARAAARRLLQACKPKSTPAKTPAPSAPASGECLHPPLVVDRRFRAAAGGLLREVVNQ